ncbi:amino acid adenylation domain-containing protein, partial [Rhodococcus sp. NM-2]|uniref:amino acid adenylation domain-containing protein n=1 Tax=Rhodococcus sp. NM-2 TaxID=3401174 RepID=UPI003AAF5DCB
MDTRNRSDATARSRPHAFPLTPAQRGIWLAQRLAPDVPRCIAQYVEVRGALDLAVLDEASVTAGRESESAFLRVFEIDGEPFQTVDPTLDLSTGFVDLGGADDPTAAAHAWMTRDYTAPLDPTRDRLATSTVLRVGNDHYLWYSRIHHIALDGYGAMTLMNRIAALYTARVEDRTPEPAGAADLRTLHRLDEAYRSSTRYESDRAYWREHLAGRRTNSSLSPTVAPAVAESSLETATLSASATERLDSSGERLGVPPATVVIATFGTYLARMTGRDDVLVDLPVSGRTTVLLQRSGGMLVGLAPLQVSTAPDDTVATLTRRVHHEILGALRHQRFTLEDIRRETDATDSLSGPMVNVMLFRPRIRFGPLTGDFHVVTSGPVADLLVNVYRTAAAGRMVVEFRGNPHRYSRDELARHLRSFVGLLEEFLAADPGDPVAGVHAETAHEGVRSRRRTADLDYWRTMLADLPHDTPLPRDYTRRAGTVDRLREHVEAHVTADLHHRIENLGRDCRFAAYTVSHAALTALLARLGGVRDVVLGTPAGARGWPLLLRTRVDGTESFTELLERTRTTELGAFTHADVTFDEVAAALTFPAPSTGRQPFQVAFDVQAGDHPHEPDSRSDEAADLWIHIVERPGRAGLDLRLTFVREFFEPSTIRGFADRLVRVLDQVTAHPDIPVRDFDLLSSAERRRLVPARGDPGVPPRTLPDLLVDAAHRDPDAIAVVDAAGGGIGVTYRQLDDDSTRLARLLLARGAGPETVVALALPRSADLVRAVWAVAKSGAAFLPVDPGYPEARITHMLTDSGATLGVTVGRHRDDLPGVIEWIELHDRHVEDTLSEHTDTPVGDADRPRPLRSDHPAYLIYTSGSTGVPKGVVVTHRGIANLIAAQIEGLDVPPTGRVAQFASPSFDASLFELLAAVGSGARVVIVPPEVVGGAELERILTEHRVTHAVLTPTTLATLDPLGVPTLSHLTVAGEACPPEVASTWTAGRRVVNAYGPTEATIMATISAPLVPDEPVTLGPPVRGFEVVVLDDRLRPVPPGTVGELYLAGPGLARGYRNRAGLDAARFVAAPFGSPGTRMYRTGDLVRWRVRDEEDPSTAADLTYVGRSDFQVKVRGFRIELGEIEAVLRADPSVGFAVATAATDPRTRDAAVIAYVHPTEGRRVDVGEVHRRLARTLPAHMLPAAVVPVDVIPRTPSGKLDRAALPVPTFAPRSGAGHRRPRTPTEDTIASVFETVLGVAGVGADDDYVDLGGGSLAATRVVARLSSALETSLDVRDLFEHPTVAALADVVESRRGDGSERSPLRRFPRPARIPLSPAQERMWFVNQYDPHSPAYDIPLVVRLTGHLDVGALVAAIADIVERHESLRTVYPASDDGPHQVILPAERAQPRVETVRVDNPTDLDAHVARAAAAPFDVTVDAPLRASLFTIGGTDHVLALVIHHIAADGASAGPLARDLSAAYRARVDGRAPAWEPPAVQYVDYALWQHAVLGRPTDPDSLASRQLDYWSESLRGSPPLLALPTDHPRPQRRSLHGGRVDFHLPPELHAGMRALSRTCTSTLFMTCHAALAVVLARLAGTYDVSIGTPVAGRGEPALDDVVGMFVNTLVLRTRIDPEAGFADTIRTVRDVDLGAFAHADYPFEKLVDALEPERTESRSPLFQVLLEFQNVLPAGHEARELDLPGLHVTAVGYDPKICKFDLQVWLSERRDDGGAPQGIDGGIVYATDLFDEETVRGLADRLVRVLKIVTTEPDTVVGNIDLLTDRERDVALRSWTAPDEPGPATTLPEEFARTAARQPDAVALSFAGDTLSYGELADRVNRIARLLHDHGAEPERLVAVAIPHSMDYVAVTLGVLAAGGVCLPLDPGWASPTQLSRTIPDVDAAILVTTSAVEEHFPHGHVPTLVLDAPGTVADLARRSGHPLAAVDVGAGPSPDAAAYVLLTRGSTALPKPVSVTHRAVLSALARPAVTAGEVWAMVPTFAPGVTVLTPWSAFLHGGRLEVVDDATASSPSALADLVHRRGVTMLAQTPAAYEHLSRARESAPGADELRSVLLTGDPVGAAVVAAPEVVAVYASVETVWFAAATDLAPESGADRMGYRPGPGRRFAVLDDRLQPVPPGVVGALYIGGPALARGYHCRASATSTHFVASPFGPTGERMFRTGDAARITPNGSLNILWRRDFQTELRGYRIPLGDIDTVLTAHPQVANAVTVDHTPRAGQPALVTYVVPAPGSAPAISDIRAHAAMILPPPWVPGTVVVLDRLPVTETGDVDLDALPVPEELRHSPVYHAPATPTERTVSKVIAQVLGIGGVGVDDNFFELGGTSLDAAKVVARIDSGCGTRLGIRSLFEAPTVRGLAAVLDASEVHPDRPALGPRVHTEPAPVSFAQRRMWFVNQFDVTSAVYNVPMVVRLTGRLDVAALRAALLDVLVRHEPLRTLYPLTDTGPVQVVVPAESVSVDLAPIPVADAAHVSGPIDEVVAEGFDVTVRPPVRVRLWQLDDRDHVLAVVVHHIVADGASLVPLARDLSTAYTARRAGRAPVWEPLPVQFSDFSVWQREVLGSVTNPASPVARQLDFWRTALADLPERLELPLDRPRPATASYRAAAVPFVMPETTYRRLVDFAGSHHTTTFVVIHAALAVLLSRLAATTDVVVGSPTAGRGEQALDPLVGMFVGTLVLRTTVDPASPFGAVVAAVRDADLAAFAHADIPFETLVDELHPPRSAASHPLFQVMLSFQNIEPPRLELPGLEVHVADLDPRVSPFDLNVVLREQPAEEGSVTGISGQIVYATDLFDAGTISAFSARLLRVITAAVTDPEAVVGDIDILDDAERGLVLDRWNATAHDLPAATIVDLFEARVAAAPDAPAVRCEDRILTYAELDTWSTRLARSFLVRGIGAESIVALMLPRSFEMLAAMYAVVKSGAAVLALDPGHPTDRLESLIDTASAALVVTTADADLPAPAGVPVARFDDIDREARDAAPVTDADRGAPLHPDNLAYVVYTSGSTGTPKGVAVSHAAIANQLAWSQAHLPLHERDRTVQKAPIAFDVAIWECFAALCSGSILVLLRPDRQLDLDYLSGLLDDTQITVVEFVPSLLDVFVNDHRHSFPGSLRRVLTGGEAISARTASSVLAQGVRLGNMYGPAEAAVTATYHDVAADQPAPAVPIGSPVWNTQVYVVDGRLHPVVPGVTGEMYLGGAQLARGYLGRPGITAGRFVANPFGVPGSRMYRTGDLARWNPDGQLDYHGRTDFQVQLHGYRVEPGEVESALLRHPGISQAVVVPRADRNGAHHLVGYVVPVPGIDVAEEELLDHTRSLLPSHMVPSAVISLSTLPLTPHGKVDRNALPALDFTTRAAEFRSAGTAVEESLVALVGDVLGLESLGVDDSFFALGGDSIMAIQLVARAKTAGLALAPRDVFEYRTIARLARAISTRPEPSAVLSELPGGGIGSFPLPPAARWLLERGGNLDTYCQSVLLTAPPDLDTDTLTATVQTVLDHHDMLRARLRRGTTDEDTVLEVLAADQAPRVASLIRRVALDDPADLKGRAEVESRAAAARLDPENGIMLQLVWLDPRTQPGHLLLTIHHLATDG